MIDIKLLRNDFNEIEKNISLRNTNYPALEEFKIVDAQWRKTATELQALITEKNILSDQIGSLIKNGEKDKIDDIKKQVLSNKENIDALQKQANELEFKLRNIMFSIPNILDKEHNVLGEKNIGVPIGKDENDNIEIISGGTKQNFSFKPLSHYELGIKNNWIDFERGRKITGERGYIMVGGGARLFRALRDFTLDLHINDANYTEILAPILLNKEPLYGLGKLPLFEEDMYQTTDAQFLAGTEEHPLTAMYMNEVIDSTKLPIKLTSSSANFRKEAGSAGKDTKGILRVHQFYNTELVNFALPEQSWDCLREMTLQAEKVLKLLDIPYRILKLCSGDIGDAAATTYDLEVWVPSENKYREISSCSNVLDYQARGLSIKYIDTSTKKTNFVHTLNGTGTSLNRLWIAIVENFQNEDGTVNIPTILQRYIGEKRKI